MRGIKGKDIKALTRRAMRRAWAAARVLAEAGDELIRLSGGDPDDVDTVEGDDFRERVLGAFPVEITGAE
jgi:hypothetical protein